MKNILILTVLALFMLSCSSSKKETWIPLFNGKDLTGWEIKIKGYPLNENYKTPSGLKMA